jgi:hypothetical protein
LFRKTLAESLDTVRYSLELRAGGRYRSTIILIGKTAKRRGKWSLKNGVLTLEQTHENDEEKKVKQTGYFANGRLRFSDIDALSEIVLKKRIE